MSAPVPLRVAFFIDSVGSGGAQRQASEIACQLATRRQIEAAFVVYHDIDFFAPRLRHAGIPLHLLRKRAGFDPLLSFGLRRFLRGWRPQLLHAFLTPSCLYALLAVRSLRAAERPLLVSSERSALRHAGVPRSALRLERFVYRRSDAVTTNAASVARDVEALLHVEPARVHYVPNGIDLAAWDRRAAEGCPFELEPTRFHLALVGGLREEKNHGVLLEALTLLPAELRAPLCVWFVGGETGTPESAEHVRSEIDRRGLHEMIRVVPATPRIAALMHRLDALVMPSAFEGSPNVLLEAMASSLPTIASRVGDVPNMLEEGQSGFMVEPGDARGLAAALERLLRLAPEQRAALGRRARATVEQRFGLEVVAQRYLELYRALVTGGAAQPSA